MSKITCPFVREPIIDFFICPSSAYLAALHKSNPNAEIHKPIKVRGLIDTGFEGGMLIHAPLLKSWGLKTRNFVAINSISAGGVGFFGEYAWETELGMRFEIANPRHPNIHIESVPATLVEFMGTDSYNALIGCQILQRCTFVYDGPKKELTLAFHNKP